MYCPDCGKVFYKKLDFYEHLIYNEGYDEAHITRLVNVGFLTQVEKVEIMNVIMNNKVNQ